MLLPIPLLLILHSLSGPLTAVDCPSLTEEEQGEKGSEYDGEEECSGRDIKDVDELLREATGGNGASELLR